MFRTLFVSCLLSTAVLAEGPIISPIEDQTIQQDTSTEPIRFYVEDPDTSPRRIRIEAFADNEMLVPDEGIRVRLHRNFRTITITPAEGQSGVAIIAVTASDGASSDLIDFAVNVVPLEEEEPPIEEEPTDPSPTDPTEPPPSEPPPSDPTGLSDPYPGIQRIGLGVDSSGDAQFSAGTSITAQTQAELDQAIAEGKAGSLDEVIIDGVQLTILRGGLNGFTRTADNPFRIKTTNGGTLRLEIHDSKYSGTGIAFVDCDFIGVVQFRGSGWHDILFERSRLWLDYQGERFTDGSAGAPAINLQVRNCTIKDHWGPGQRIQGMYLWNVHGVLVQGCWFHHNGWKPGASRSLPFSEGGGSIHNHNMYINQPCRNVVVHQCVSSAASSHGCHLKCGGIIQDCLFIDCPISFQPGYGGDGYFGIYGLVDALAFDNVAIGSDEINTADGNYRGQFAWLTCLNDAVIEGNVAIANTTTASNDAVFWVDRKSSPTGNFTLQDNRAYGWPGGVFISPGTNAVGTITEVNNQLDLPLEARHDQLLLDVRAITNGPGWNYGAPGVDRALLQQILDDARL